MRRLSLSINFVRSCRSTSGDSNGDAAHFTEVFDDLLDATTTLTPSLTVIPTATHTPTRPCKPGRQHSCHPPNFPLASLFPWHL